MTWILSALFIIGIFACIAGISLLCCWLAEKHPTILNILLSIIVLVIFVILTIFVHTALFEM